MTGSVNCDIVSKGRGDFRGVKCITVFKIPNLFWSFDIGIWDLFVFWCLEFDISSAPLLQSTLEKVRSIGSIDILFNQS